MKQYGVNIDIALFLLNVLTLSDNFKFLMNSAVITVNRFLLN